MYQNGEITNARTAFNLMSKLTSKRPEVAAKKINEFLDQKMMINPIDRDLDVYCTAQPKVMPSINYCFYMQSIHPLITIIVIFALSVFGLKAFACHL